MRNIKSFLLYCCCLTCLAWQGCGPDCDADCPEIKTAPQEFLDYWFFPYGSQWVYQLKDSAGIYDTTYTATYESWVHTKNPECNDGFTPCQTNYRHVVEHSNDSYFPQPGPEYPYESHRCEYNSSDKSWYLFHSSGTNRLHSFSTFVTYPFQEGAQYLNGNFLCSTQQTFEWNGRSYPMLRICNESQPPVGSTFFLKELWFAQGLGLVRSEYNNGDIWELVDYEIAKT